jgi:anti-sigma factor RsiW
MMRPWLRWRGLACRRAVVLMSEYLDGRLAADERARLERHLDECPGCVEYLAQLRVTIDALGRAEPGDLPANALAEFVDLYRKWRSADSS